MAFVSFGDLFTKDCVSLFACLCKASDPNFTVNMSCLVQLYVTMCVLCRLLAIMIHQHVTTAMLVEAWIKQYRLTVSAYCELLLILAELTVLSLQYLKIER